MAQTPITNGMLGLDARNAINGDIAELFTLVGSSGGSTGTYASTMSASNTGAQNTTALQADAAAASAASKRLVVSTPGTYTIAATAFTSLTLDIEFMPGVILTPDVSLKTFSGKIFQATSCDVKLKGFNVDGAQNAVGCWRSDFGTFYAEDTKIINMGSLAIGANAGHIGTYGFSFKDMTSVHINRCSMSDFVAPLDGFFANNSGKVNGIFFYESDNATFDRLDFDRFYGEDCDYIHIFDERGYASNGNVAKRTVARNQMKGTISKSRFRYTEGTRRVWKFQGGDWDCFGNDIRPNSTFSPVDADAPYGPVTGISIAANGQVTTATAHNVAIGQKFVITGVVGTTGINGIVGTAGALTTSTNLDTGIDTSAMPAWISGGQVRRVIQVAGISVASPGVVTTTDAHLFNNGQEIIPSSIIGTTQLNGNRYVAMNSTGTTFELYTRGANGVLTAVDTGTMGAWISGGTLARYTDVGDQCLNLADCAGSFEGNVKIFANYIDARGFGICVAGGVGPDNRMHAHHNTIVGSYSLALRMNPESLITQQTIVPTACYTIGSTKVAIFDYNRIIGFVNALTPQGSNNHFTDNILEDPGKLWLAAGTSTQKNGLTVARNRVITRTPGFLAGSQCATISNVTNFDVSDNTLEQDGNTTHSLIFCEATNANGTGRANNNKPPLGLAGFVGFKASSAAVPNVIISRNGSTPASGGVAGRGPVDTMVDLISIGNVGAGQDTLNTHVISAGTLNYTVGEVVEAEWFGTKAGNANAKAVAIKVNSTTLFTKTMTTGTAGFWRAKLTLICNGATSQRYFVEFAESGGAVTIPVEHAAGDITEATNASMALGAFATAVADNDVVNTATTCVAKSGRTLNQA